MPNTAYQQLYQAAIYRSEVSAATVRIGLSRVSSRGGRRVRVGQHCGQAAVPASHVQVKKVSCSSEDD
jgi:hypothetical protein